MTVNFGVIGGTMGDVVTALNAGLSPYTTASLDADGALKFSNGSGFDTYSINVVSDTSDRAGTGTSFPEMFGVGVRYPSDAGLEFGVMSNIAADPELLALAKIDPTGTPALTHADNRGALALQDLATAAMTFDTVGDLIGSTVTVADFAAQILAKAGLDAARADSLQSDRAALSGALNSRMQEVSGVNMDEELANLIIYQNAYNASARLITTAREMYDVLLTMV